MYGVPLGEINEQLGRFPQLQDSSLWKKIFFKRNAFKGTLDTFRSSWWGGDNSKPIASYVPVEKTQKGVPIMHWEKSR